jgi:IS30 family transposase
LGKCDGARDPRDPDPSGAEETGPRAGKNGSSAIGTLVERSTRYVMLVHLPFDRSAERLRDALVETMATLPPISSAP